MSWSRIREALKHSVEVAISILNILGMMVLLWDGTWEERRSILSCRLSGGAATFDQDLFIKIFLSTSTRPWTILNMRVRRLIAFLTWRLCHPRLCIITGFSVIVSFEEKCRPTVDFLKCCNITFFIGVPHTAAMLHLWSYKCFIRSLFNIRGTMPKVRTKKTKSLIGFSQLSVT